MRYVIVIVTDMRGGIVRYRRCEVEPGADITEAMQEITAFEMQYLHITHADIVSGDEKEWLYSCENGQGRAMHYRICPE